MGFKLRKSAKGMSMFEQYEEYDVGGCYKEQHRLLRVVQQLKDDKKVWNAANKGLVDDCEKKLDHLVAKAEFLESDSELGFSDFLFQRKQNSTSEAKIRLKLEDDES